MVEEYPFGAAEEMKLQSDELSGPLIGPAAAVLCVTRGPVPQWLLCGPHGAAICVPSMNECQVSSRCGLRAIALLGLEPVGPLAQGTQSERYRGVQGAALRGFSCEKPGKSEQSEKKSAEEGAVSARPFQDPRGRCRSGRSHGIRETITRGVGAAGMLTE